MRRLSGLLLFFCAATVWAGAQQYEPLAASVRAALHKAVSDARPAVSSFKSPLEAADWLAAKDHRANKIPAALRKAVSDRWPDHFCVIQLEPIYAKLK